MYNATQITDFYFLRQNIKLSFKKTEWKILTISTKIIVVLKKNKLQINNWVKPVLLVNLIIYRTKLVNLSSLIKKFLKWYTNSDQKSGFI